MSGLTTSSTDQWLQYQYYQNQAIDEFPEPHGGFSDSISVSTTSFSGTDTSNMLAPESSCAAGNDLSPRGSIGKPVRRRSRASRRTPTTLLNASIKNFRALVQQYTGCQSVASPTKHQKGPITLSFGPSSDHQNELSTLNGFGQLQFQEQDQQYHHQEHLQGYQGQQGLLPSEGNNSEFSGGFGGFRPNTMSVDNFGWQ